MYSFVLRPRWLLTHAVILLVGAACLLAGFWQLDRLEQRRDRNELRERRMRAPAVPPHELGRDREFRRVHATGDYDPDREFVLLARSLDGRPGHHLLTPLVTASGRALIVDRGWVPFQFAEPPVREATPPTGDVRIQGIVLESQDARARPVRAQDERRRLGRADVDAMAASLPYPVYPFYVRLEEQEPRGRELPVPAPLPPLGEGRHFAYAVQWFLFVPVGLAGYAAILRREARRGRQADDVDK